MEVRKSREEIRLLAKNEIEKLRWIKIIGIGDRCVGKTSLIKTFCESEFSKVYYETVGVDYGFKLHSLGEGQVRISFWDFGGDPAYQLVRKDLYQDSQICLVVYDASNRTSFDNVEAWIQEISPLLSPKTLVVIVGNKCDITKNQVKLEEAESWARRRGFRHYRTSASSGEGVSKMFNDLLSIVTM